MSFNANFQYKFIARKIIAKYGELTEIQGEECASTQRAIDQPMILEKKKTGRTLSSANGCKGDSKGRLFARDSL